MTGLTHRASCSFTGNLQNFECVCVYMSVWLRKKNENLAGS
jgi:hypothetical protein